ncbi:protein transport protein sec31, partial [Trypanosoma cruzi]
PQFAPQGGYAAPQQNYVDPSRPLPPPPLPSGLRGASVPGGQALARPTQLAGIQQMQQPMSSQGTGVAPPPPPPPHPGAPVVPPNKLEDLSDLLTLFRVCLQTPARILQG